MPKTLEGFMSAPTTRSVPVIDLSDPMIHGGCNDLARMLTDCERLFGNKFMATFLNIVPERGHALLRRFAIQRSDRQRPLSFSEFVREVVEHAPTAGLPVWCVQNIASSRKVFAMPVLAALPRISGSSFDKMADLHFGDHWSPIVTEALMIEACYGCMQHDCELNARSNQRSIHKPLGPSRRGGW